MDASPATDPPDSAAEIFCPGCGYDLRGIDSARCPECGLAIDRSTLAMSLPWAHRKQIGKRRAYWKTQRLAMFHPRQLAMATPLQWSDACAFRRWTARRAFVPLAAILVALFIATSRFPTRPSVLTGFNILLDEWLKPVGLEWLVKRPMFQVSSMTYLLEIGVLVTTLVGAYFGVHAAVSVGGYFFESRVLPAARRDRAVIVSVYAAAPLGLVLLATPILLMAAYEMICRCTQLSLSYSATSGYQLDTFPRLTLLAAICVIVPSAWAWIVSLKLLRRTTACGSLRVLVTALALPLAGATVFVIILAGSFATALLVALIIASLN